MIKSISFIVLTQFFHSNELNDLIFQVEPTIFYYSVPTAWQTVLFSVITAHRAYSCMDLKRTCAIGDVLFLPMWFSLRAHYGPIIATHYHEDFVQVKVVYMTL